VTQDPAWFFAVVGSIFGLAMAFAIPLGNTPDESTHMARAYEIAHGRIIAGKTDGIVGMEMPVSLMDPIARTGEGEDVRGQPTVKLTFREGVRFWSSPPLDRTNRGFRPTEGTATYFAISYIPQAIAVAIGESVCAPVGVIYLLAKIFALIVHQILGFWTIRLWPIKPWAMAAIQLLPMMVAGSVTPGADPMTLSVAGLLAAAVFRLRLTPAGPRLGPWAVLGLGALGAACALTKPVMALFPVLFWMIPRTRLSRRWAWAERVGLIGGPIAIGAIWLVFSSTLVGGQSAANGQDMSGQVAFLMSHPLAAVLVFIRTWYTDFSVQALRSMAGIFGWMDTGLPTSWVICVFIAICGYLVCYHRRSPQLDARSRVFLAAWTALFVYGTFMALYVGWTPVGMRHIEGVQGRYLLPALFLALPIVPNLARLRDRAYRGLTRVVPVVLLAVSLLYIVERYYISPLNELAQLV
jgi:uncharacterized membrane protein